MSNQHRPAFSPDKVQPFFLLALAIAAVAVVYKPMSPAMFFDEALTATLNSHGQPPAVPPGKTYFVQIEPLTSEGKECTVTMGTGTLDEIVDGKALVTKNFTGHGSYCIDTKAHWSFTVLLSGDNQRYTAYAHRTDTYIGSGWKYGYGADTAAPPVVDAYLAQIPNIAGEGRM